MPRTLYSPAKRLASSQLYGDDGAAVERFGGMLKAGRKHAAGAAPRSPEVDDDGDVGLGDDGFKVFVVDVNDFAHDDSSV